MWRLLRKKEYENSAKLPGVPGSVCTCIVFSDLKPIQAYASVFAGVLRKKIPRGLYITSILGESFIQGVLKF
jgi:hypothetical protein